MNPLPRIRTGILRHPLDQQVLAYDSKSDQVHLLDPTTACVLELLEEGGWTAEGIAIEIADRIGVAPNAGFLPLAIEELRRAGLLDESADKVAPLPEVTRRDVIRGLALTSAAAVLVPTVATLTASRGYAQTVGNVAACGPCTPAGSQGNCAPPNTCINGTNGPRCSGGTNPTTGSPTGFSGSFSFNGGNCGTGTTTARQTEANALCCSGSATLGNCSGNNPATQLYTCN